MAEARSWLEIDLGAVVANAQALARRAAPARLCAVVKSNAYGHGLVHVARALAGSDLDGLRFGVFAAGEAFALREAGIEHPIFVVGPVADDDLAAAAQARLELAILDEGDVDRVAARRIGAHVKIDTGTNRFGVARAQAAGTLRRCAELGVGVVGLYSHLANAEDLDKEFTLAQLAALKKVAAEYPGTKAPALHIAASAAAMMWPETRLDMVRCGIALYGEWPSPEVRAAMAGDAPAFALRPALRWFAPIAQIRDVGKGDSVGYGCAFVPERDSRIAVLPLGYADGLPRAAGNGRMRVRIGEARAPIVGRVCMNACMLDVSDVRSSPARQTVAELDIEDLARAAGTINYEILARLPGHLERRYQGRIAT
ncbi:MAG TPA: alanine racemase [Candidatus Tumulicola sp.]|nr:alanine racemase [Candidatus Tumulicola sp.]